MFHASETKAGTAVEFSAIVDPSVDPQLQWGAELRDLATAMVSGEGLEAARAALVAVSSPEMAAAAVGVCANFAMMNRILDATGCPVPKHARALAEVLGVALPD